jgi:CBS domain containing-hemolysin-like protein
MQLDSIIILKILAVIFLVLLNGFFVAAEFALVKIRDTQLEPLANKGHSRAKAARHTIAHLDRFLSAAQLGITLASLGLGWIGEPVFTALLHPLLNMLKISDSWQHYVSFAVGFSAITFLHIVVGEQAPKWLAIQKPLPTSMWVAYPMIWFYKISVPFIWMLNNSSQWLLRRLGMEPVPESELVHSEEELRLMFTATHEKKGGSSFGRDIVLNALDLRRRIARDVMRHRQEIVSLNTEASIVECIGVAEKTRYSRLPLCECGNLDKTLGIIHIKDLFAMRSTAKTGADLIPAARKLIYVPETAHLEKLLRRFLEQRTHFAIVVDEFGGTTGMITLENILEELVGQIQDEFDQEKPRIIKVNENTWDVSGKLPLHELEQLTRETLAEKGVTTVSGWVTHGLNGFPKVGDVMKVGNYELRVEKMEGMLVDRLILIRQKDEEPAEI